MTPFAFSIKKRKTKILFSALALFLLLATAATLIPEYASASRPPPTPNPNTTLARTVLSKTGGAISITASAIALIFGALWLAQYFFSILLVYIAGAFDFMMSLNIAVVPASLDIVQLGWTTLRDITNAFFILVIIWISITIIFGVEQYGGKKLLFRAIAVALLVNFSLAFVAAVFGFANIFAGEFYKKYPTKQVATQQGTQTAMVAADYIVEKLAIRTLYTPMSADAAKKMFDEQGRIISAPTPTESGQASSYSPFAFSEALGLQEADAGVLSFLGKIAGKGAACAIVGIGATPVGGALCAAASILVFDVALPAAFTWLANAGVQAVTGADLFTHAARLALIDFMLFIALAVFSIMLAMLIMRYIAVILLSIISPLAFLLHIVPGGWGDNYWKKWYTQLFRWAFFLPAFVFLFYLALYFLGSYGDIIAPRIETNAALGGAYYILFYLIAAAFMIASVVVARKIAGSLADIGLGYATKALTFGLGLAAGGTMLAAAPALRAAQPLIERGKEAVGRVPIIGGAARSIITQTTAPYFAKQRQAVNDAKKKYEHWSSADQAAVANSFLKTPTERLAATLVLAEKGNLHKEMKSPEIQKMVQIATNFNMQAPLLGAAPQFADTTNVSGARTNDEALDIVIKRMGDKSAINKNAFLNDAGNITVEGERIINAMWRNSSPNDLAQIGRKNYELMQAMQDQINDIAKANMLKTQIPPQKVTQIKRYLGGTAGQNIGWTRPHHW